MQFDVATLTAAEVNEWVALRAQLWPHQPIEEHRRDAHELLGHGERAAVFVAKASDALIGFAEATLRIDYVNGTSTSPVTFLEGLYVLPRYRHSGVARALCKAVENWGSRAGCTEFASDALLENEQGRVVHEALGFRETERVVYFLKPIDPDAA